MKLRPFCAAYFVLQAKQWDQPWAASVTTLVRKIAVGWVLTEPMRGSWFDKQGQEDWRTYNLISFIHEKIWQATMSSLSHYNHYIETCRSLQKMWQAPRMRLGKCTLFLRTKSSRCWALNEQWRRGRRHRVNAWRTSCAKYWRTDQCGLFVDLCHEQWATMHSQCGNQSMLSFWIERSSESESFQLDLRSCTLNTLLFATHRATHLALVAGLSCGLKVKRWWLRRMVSSTSPSRCALLVMDCHTCHSATTLPFSMNSYNWRG